MFEAPTEVPQHTVNIPSGVSIESASYIENNNQINNEFDTEEKENNETEYTPKLFSGEQSYQTEEDLQENDYKTDNTEQLFDQDTNEEDDFEIPAFLRKQKF